MVVAQRKSVPTISPNPRLSDHRAGYTSHNLPNLMDGDLDDLFDELATQDEANRLAAEGLGA